MKIISVLISLCISITCAYAQDSSSLIGKKFLDAYDLGLFDCSGEVLYDYSKNGQGEDSDLVLHVLKEKEEQECYKGNMVVLVSEYSRLPDGKVEYYTIVSQKILKTPEDVYNMYAAVYDKTVDKQIPYLVSYKESKNGRQILSLWSFDFSKRDFIVQEVKTSMEMEEDYY